MSGLDRVRPRRPTGATGEPPPGADREGRRALYSVTATTRPARGSVTVDCTRCGARSVLGPLRFLRAAVPSLHLPVLRRGAESFLRCPACRRFTWVRARLVL